VRRLIDFLKSRPTEVWLGLWTAIVGVLVASGVEIAPAVTAAVATLIGWIVTFLADHSESLGPR
jgi:ABC-type microcin C transport system permease subunit YejE